MKRWRVATTMCALALAVSTAAAADVRMVSPLALALVRPADPGSGLLAQRVIDREWGPSEDSTYREVEVPGWKSEGAALALSAAVPGAGQLYNGEASGWLYLIGEALGWAGRIVERQKADNSWHDATSFLGDPNDSSSAFSFSRYQARTGQSAAELQSLWSGDRSAYYRELRDNPSYLAGFSGTNPSATFAQFDDIASERDDLLRRVGWLDTALMLNHVIAAFDALRVTRIHDLPLRQQYHLDLGENYHHGRPELRAAIVRRF